MPNLLATLGQQYEIIAGTGIAENVTISFDNGGGDIGSYNIFEVTGMVAVKIYAYCITDITGASATLELGTTTTTGGLLATTTGTDIDALEIWHDNSPDATLELSSVSTEKIVSDDIKLKIATAPVTGGSISFTAIWKPLTPNASVTATSPLTVASLSLSPSASASPSGSASPSASASPSSSGSKSASPSGSASPSASKSPSTSVSVSPSPSQGL